MRGSRNRFWAALVLVGMLGGGAARQSWARFNPEPCRNSFSPQQEIAEGRKAAAQVYKQMPVLPDSSPVTQYVQQLGARLVEYAPGTKWPFNFHVVDEADINAFALPGGPVFINLGTIQAVDTEAQLAGVMAHEISHVVLRHATCNASKEQRQKPFWQLGQIVAGVLLPGAVGDVAAAGVGLGAQSVFLRYSRDAERQADLMGTDILYDAGYDPRALPQFFEVIEGKYGKGGAQFLSDHPNPGNRVGYVNDEIATLPPRTNYIKTSNDFKRTKQMVSGMHAYTAKEIASGVWKRGEGVPGGAEDAVGGGSAAGGGGGLSSEPSGVNGWQRLKAPQYRVDYPDGWKVYSGGARGSVTVAPQGGVQMTDNQQGGITTGFIVDAFTPEQGATANDPARSMDELVKRLQADNPDMHTAGGVEAVTVNQRPGRSVELNNTSAGENGAGTPEHDWLVGIQQGDGTLRYIIFVAPASQFEGLRPTFEQVLRSFRVG